MTINVEQKQRVIAGTLPFLRKNALLLPAIGTSAVILFANAVRIPMPLGYGGLYSLMAEQVSLGNFFLPQAVPYYGPGGIPFAYPPLGFYLMALALKLGLSSITYLRFFPPFYTLLSLIPLFLLVKKYAESSLAAGIAVVYTAFSPAFYVMHAWAAGAVRAPALLLLFCGIYLLECARTEDGIRYALLAGTAGGLTFLTHLFYGVFFTVWALAVVALDLRSFAWKRLFWMLLAAAGTVAPWVYVLLSRHGLEVFSNALFSHDNVAVLGLLQSPNNWLAWMAAKISTLVTFPLTYLAMGLGLIQLMVTRQYTVPLLMAISLLVLPSEGARFIVVLIAILVGASLLNSKLWSGRAAPLRYVFGGLTALALVIEGVNGIRAIDTTGPGLDPSAFQVAEYVQKHTPAESRYLFVTGQTEAEWFPYLLKRNPLVSKWGSEWLGTYNEQRLLQSQVSECRDLQSLECLRELHFEILPGDFLITRRTQRRLSAQLEMDSRCSRMATFGRYIIWKAQCISE